MAGDAARSAAFFDLDRTLVAENTGLLYARWGWRQGELGRRELALAAGWTALYHFGLIDIDRAYARALRHYEGRTEAEVEDQTRRWFAEEVAGRLLLGARRTLAMHRAAGRPCLILSNTSPWAAAAASATWGCDGWIGNALLTDAAGRLGPGFERPLCYGHGKVVRAEAWAAAHGVDLGASWFYSDSISDLPMLERVGHAHVVQPDPRLRLLAWRQGWPIHDWRR